MDNSKNPKNAGRRPNFTDEDLLSIIDAFMLDGYHGYRGEISASKVADYANKRLGYRGIKYYHLTQRKTETVNNKIKEIQNTPKRKGQLSGEVVSFKEIPIEDFFNQYKNNPTKLKQALLLIQNETKQAYNALIREQNENRRLKSKLAEATKLQNASELTKKNFAIENSELKEQIKILTSLISFEDQIMMCKYILANTSMDGDLASQYLLALLKSKVIKSEDAEEIKNSATEAINEALNKSVITPTNVVQLFNNTIANDIPVSDIEDDEVHMDELNELLDEDD